MQTEPVVLITGGARGLGYALAEEFARRHARLILLDLPLADWNDAAAHLTALGASQVSIGATDVTQLESLQGAVAAAVGQCGEIDILIANAGIGVDTPVTPLAIDGFKQQVDINLTGVAHTVAAVLPSMIKRQRGQLVAIASLAGYRGLPGLAGYCASKAGVIALMDSLRLDLREHGIVCTTVCPGWINTGVIHTLTSVKPGVTPLPVAAKRIVKGILRKKRFIAFPWWLRGLFVLNRTQPVGMGDSMLRIFWRLFGGK